MRPIAPPKRWPRPKERGRAAVDQAKDRADEWLDEVREYVREKPVQAVAIALGAGWLLGRILRR